MHKLCQSKSSKTKLTDLHYISDKNHSYSHHTQIIEKKNMYIHYSFKFWKLNAPI